EEDILVLTVKGGKPEAILNDKPININAISVSVGAVAECKCNGEVLEKAFPVPNTGSIGLQAETGKFEFRHVRIKETTATSEAKPKKRLLVITESKGFVHGCVKRPNPDELCLVEKTLIAIGETSGDFEAVCSQDSRKEITAENLAK